MVAKTTAFVSCDPGSKGSYCLLIPSTKQVLFFPTTEKPIHIFNWFKSIQLEFNLAVTMIEDVHAIPGAAAKSSFNFGYNLSTVTTIPLVAGSSVDKVTPKKWQTHVGVKVPKKIKGTARQKAIKTYVANICDRLYPNVSIRGTRGGLQDGKSDSLMIAHYASQTFKI